MKKTVVTALFLIYFVCSIPISGLGQTRIRFARGRTSASVSSTISGGSQRKFVLSARAGQDLSATVSSRNGCVVLGNQQTAESYSTDQGNNIIDLFNRCRTTTSFTLTVSIR